MKNCRFSPFRVFAIIAPPPCENQQIFKRRGGGQLLCKFGYKRRIFVMLWALNVLKDFFFKNIYNYFLGTEENISKCALEKKEVSLSAPVSSDGPQKNSTSNFFDVQAYFIISDWILYYFFFATIFFFLIFELIYVTLCQNSRKILKSFLVSETEISTHGGVSVGGGAEISDPQKSTLIFLLKPCQTFLVYSK